MPESKEKGPVSAGNRGVAVGGNVVGSTIVTGDLHIHGQPAAPPPTGYRCMAPLLEKGFVERQELEEIRAILCGDGASAVGITSALRGAGGFGKTTLAQRLCQDDRVQAAYPDGILWTTIGDQATPADRLSRVLDLIRWWARADPPHFDTLTAAAAHLREILTGQRVLVVVDDAWIADDVEPFRGAGAGLLVTSRHHEALADCVCIDVDAMRLDEAVKLLMVDLPGAESFRPRFEDLARTLGEWPLLLKLVNGTLLRWVQRGLGIERALEEVAQAGLESFDRRDSTAREKAVSRTMEVSLRHLSEEERRRYEALAIFPEDENVPLQILERLWSCPAFEVRDLSLLLHGLSLLRDLDLGTGTLRLHDVFRKYLIGRQGGAMAELHQDFLARSRPASGRWADLPVSESYLWRFLGYHLVRAGQSDTLRDLLLNIRFLAARLQATDVNVVIAGFDHLPGDSDLRMVQSAIRMSAHILVHHPEQLAGQLLGRLPEGTEEGASREWERVRQETRAAGRELFPGGAGFLPCRASMTPAGGPLLRTFEGHTDEVQAVAIVDAHRALSGAADHTLRLWDLESGACMRIFQGHHGSINAIGVIDAHHAISAAADRTLRLWDLESGTCLRTFEGVRIRKMMVVDPGRVLSAAADGTLRLWDLDCGTCLRTFEGHGGWVNAITVLDTRHALSAADDGMLRLWDLDSGVCVRTFSGHDGRISALTMVNPREALSAAADRTLRLWDLDSGACLRTIQGQDDWVRALAVVDTDCALSAASDGTLRLWQLSTGDCLHTVEGDGGQVTGMAVVGPYRALSSEANGTLRLWDLGPGHFPRTLEAHNDWVREVAMVDDHRALTAANDLTLWLWDLTSRVPLRTFEDYRRGVLAMAVVDAHRVCLSADDGALGLWDLDSGTCLRVFEDHVGRINAVAVVGPQCALSAGQDLTLRLWDLDSGTCLRAFDDGDGGVRAMAVVNPHQVLLAAHSCDLRLWDLDSGTCLRTFSGHCDWVRALALVNAHQGLSAGADCTLRLWDLSSGVCLHTFEGHTGGVWAVTAVGERRALSGSDDGTLRLWDLGTGACLAVFTFDHQVTAVAQLNGTVVVGDAGGNVHFLDLILPDSP